MMVRDIQVNDVDSGTVLQGRYDCAVFACGYEERCVHLPKRMSSEQVEQPIILVHSTGQSSSRFQASHERYFQTEWDGTKIELSPDDETPIYKPLHGLQSRDEVRLIVDYSSMSRTWYNGLINWAKLVPDLERVIIDFVYVGGEYKGEFSPLVINDVVALPGCAGSPVSEDRTLAVFGIGFDGAVALTVADRLEPDELYTFLASPGVQADYEEKARRENSDLIDMAKVNIKVPLVSVSSATAYLRELVAPKLGVDNILLIPLGPKPLVLASVLLSHRYEREVTCLRVSGRRKTRVNVKAADTLVSTRVTFKPSEL